MVLMKLYCHLMAEIKKIIYKLEYGNRVSFGSGFTFRKGFNLIVAKEGKVEIWKLVQAVQPPFIYEDVLVTVCCQGRNFTAKYKDVLQPGYTAKPVPFAEPEKDKDVPLPKKMEQGMVLPVVRAEKKQGFTSPPKVYTEDTLLSAMETAGNKEFEKDTEKKGLGTPATRAAILEKLVSFGYVQRKGKQMIPTEDGVAAMSVTRHRTG